MDVVRRQHVEALALVVAEEEGLVLDDRPAERPAVLLVFQRRGFRLRAEPCRRAHVEVVRRVRPIVVSEVIACPVRRIAATLHHDVDRRAALDAELCGRRLLNRQVANGVRRHQGRRHAENRDLVHDRVAVIDLVVRDPVDHEVVRRGSRAADVHALKPAARPVLDARHDVEQRVEIAAAERHRFDPLRVDAAIELVGELDDRRRGFDGDRFRLRAHFELEVDFGDAVRNHRRIACDGLEARELRRHAIQTHREFGKHEAPLGVAHGGPRLVGFGAGCGDVDAGKHAARAVRDRPRNASRCPLRERGVCRR